MPPGGGSGAKPPKLRNEICPMSTISALKNVNFRANSSRLRPKVPGSAESCFLQPPHFSRPPESPPPLARGELCRDPPWRPGAGRLLGPWDTPSGNSAPLAPIVTETRHPASSAPLAPIVTGTRHPASSAPLAPIVTAARHPAPLAPILTGTRHPASSAPLAPILTGTRHPASSTPLAPIVTGTRHPASSATLAPILTGTRHPASSTPSPQF